MKSKVCPVQSLLIKLEKETLEYIEKKYPEHFKFIIDNELNKNLLWLASFMYHPWHFDCELESLVKIDEQAREFASELFSILL